MSDIDVEIFDTNSEFFINDNKETEIEIVDNSIEIEISGLKTLKRFIGLEDTPLYYEDGKFFKVEGNKIVYADIQWKDITGDMSENEALLEEVKELVQDASLEFVNTEIQKHNEDVFAHNDIRQSVTDVSNTLNSKIDSNTNELEQQINSLSGDIKTNKNDIINLKQKDNILQEQIDNINTSIGENVSGRINELEQRVATSELDIENNTIDITNLKNKDENIQGQINDINTVISVDVANKINLLQQEVDENYIELNSNKVNKEVGKGLSSNDLTDDLLNQIETNTLNRHNHNNKDVLDLINAPFTREDKTKLDNIEDGAQVNTVTSVNGQIGDVYIPQLEQVQSDWKSVNPESKAYILNKPTKLSDFENDVEYITKDVDNLTNYTQTGVINNLLFKKVDKEVGKGLSTNDFTDELLQKLESIEDGAEKNIVTSVNGKIGDVFLDIMELDKDQIVTGQKIFLNDVIIGNTDSPQNLNLTGNSNILGDLNIEGNIIQNGEQYETHVQKVYSTNDYITLRDGAVSGLTPGNYSGLEFKLYDGINDGRLVIDNSGTARVGDVGDEQPLLTRDETASLTDKGVLIWDAENYKAKTSTEYSKTEEFAPVAFTGDYYELINTPTKLSQFEDDITPVIQEQLTKIDSNITEVQNNLTKIDNNIVEIQEDLEEKVDISDMFEIDMIEVDIEGIKSDIDNLETQKQNVLTSENAGEGISIIDGVISNTRVSAEWGNIQGDINTQTDLQDILQNKVSIDLDNLSEIGEQKLQSLSSTVLTDDVTIVKNENNVISTQAVLNNNTNSTLQGVKTWTGTLEEYNDISEKDDKTLYYITDDADAGEYIANTDLSNLTEVGQSKFDEKVDVEDMVALDFVEAPFVSYDNITNCLLEIPRNIKLELSDGTLTLKAGSELTYGDSRTIVIENDITQTCQVNATLKNLILIHEPGSNGFGIYVQGSNATSGTTPPTIATGTTDYIWFDTNTNQMKISHDTQATWSEIPLPIGVVDITPYTYTALKQIFNGIGYVGYTAWVDKGVKALIPDGRNTDGTLKNIEVTTSSLKTIGYTSTYKDYHLVITISGNIGIYVSNSGGQPDRCEYKEAENINYNNQSKQQEFIANIGKVSCDGTSITSFQPKQPFRAIDYSDKSTIAGWSMPSAGNHIALTLGASNTVYTAPVNGYVRFAKLATAANQFIYMSASVPVQIWSSAVNQWLQAYIPVRKGYTFKIGYTADGDTALFDFVPLEGEI